jgi:hypothetical protein
MNSSNNNMPKIVCAADLEKPLPSRVSRKGLPCPEIHDTYRPVDANDMNGFIKVESKDAREIKRLRVRRRLEFLDEQDE